MWSFALLVGAFMATVAGTWVYRSFATHRGIIANPNFRSLHQRPIPRGGGMVFAVVCICAVAGLGLAGAVCSDLAIALLGGGAVATIVGFIDDVRQLRPIRKLLAQAILAAWVLLAFGAQPLFHLPQSPGFLELGLSWLALVWLMNVYNFIDGIDGMAATGAIFVSIAAILVLVVAGTGALTAPDLSLIFGLIAMCSLGFLIFNWPPASIFMGDSGSLFLGFAFAALITKSVLESQISPWTWLIIFGYLAGDTTTTTIVRIFVTSKWYAEHRSHAYQNLARIWGSHLAVVLGVSAFHILWLLPLAIWSALMPATAPLAALLALGPVVFWTLRHGPIRSSS
jgi:Fuc2NAc and GlcNAc transferase